MSKLLPFPDYTRHLKSLNQDRFLALQWLGAREEEVRQLCQSLSPDVMHWSGEVWLIDLGSCQMYWQSRAQTQHLSFDQLLQEQLDKNCGPQNYQAVISDHPWQALLLLPCLIRQNFFGLIHRHSAMGDNLLQGMSWEDWWQSCLCYAGHSEESTRLELQKRRLSMQLAMRRLGCSTPQLLRRLPADQIRRRFGVFLGELWALTWQAQTKGTALVFPWRSEKPEADLCVHRTLDAPARDWDILEEDLREDLNRLRLLSSFKKGERILALEWKIVLYNLQEIPLSILFRHPHSLQHDYPQQRTALLQISFSLQRALRDVLQSQLDDPCFWIVAWDLCVTRKMQPPPRQLTLFSEGESSTFEELLNLENQLPTPLESYALREDWVPEDSFARAEEDRIFASTTPSGSSFQSLGRTRPLYMKKKAYPFSRPGQSLLWKFRERTMEKWWVKPNEAPVRDYYEVLCDQQLLWVAREQIRGHAASRFFVLGVYG